MELNNRVLSNRIYKRNVSNNVQNSFSKQQKPFKDVKNFSFNKASNSQVKNEQSFKDEQIALLTKTITSLNEEVQFYRKEFEVKSQFESSEKEKYINQNKSLTMKIESLTNENNSIHRKLEILLHRENMYSSLYKALKNELNEIKENNNFEKNLKNLFTSNNNNNHIIINNEKNKQKRNNKNNNNNDNNNNDSDDYEEENGLNTIYEENICEELTFSVRKSIKKQISVSTSSQRIKENATLEKKKSKHKNEDDSKQIINLNDFNYSFRNQRKINYSEPPVNIKLRNGGEVQYKLGIKHKKSIKNMNQIINVKKDGFLESNFEPQNENGGEEKEKEKEKEKEECKGERKDENSYGKKEGKKNKVKKENQNQNPKPKPKPNQNQHQTKIQTKN